MPLRHLLGTALLLAASQARAQPSFTAGDATLLSTGAVQAVIPSTAGFRMYFIRDGFQVLSATSSNQAAPWSIEPGVRLPSGTVVELDGASITALGVLPIAGPKLRMLYVGVSTAGHYSLLSATSTDGQAWNKEAGVRLRVNSGLGFIDSPKPFPVSGLTRLFYVADSAGGNTPANYRIFSASSTDEGLNFKEEGQVLSDLAYMVDVTSLTDSRFRLYYARPLGAATTATQVLSAVSSNGLVYAAETGVRLSTSASFSALTYPVVVRSTESFRWRMFSSYTPTGSSIPFVASALTAAPLPTSSGPQTVLRNQSSSTMSVSGEILAPNATLQFSNGLDAIPWFNVTYSGDTSIQGVINPYGKASGSWSLFVTNPDGVAGVLANALLIETPPGDIAILDNVFRPNSGGKATVTVKIFEPGRVTLKLYTGGGAEIATLFDGPLPEGDSNFLWNGTTAAGNTVASGVYLIRASGPKLDIVKKIVVIK